MVRFSTATIPGLVQTYALAAEALPFFAARPERLLHALEDPARHDAALFLLQSGTSALDCLECLEAGDLTLLRTYLTGLAYSLFKKAENPDPAGSGLTEARQ